MVFLRPGPTLDSEDLARVSGKLRQLASLEFASIYHENKDRFDPVHLFGDEVEYLIVINDHLNRKVRVLPIYPHLSRFLSDLSNNSTTTDNQAVGTSKVDIENSIITPEACSYVLESIPDQPYSLESNYSSDVANSLAIRRKRLERILYLMGYRDAKVTTLTNFCRIGCSDSIYHGGASFLDEFKRNLDPSFHPVLDISITPLNKIYDLLMVNRVRRKGAKVVVPKYLPFSSSTTSTTPVSSKGSDENRVSGMKDSNKRLKLTVSSDSQLFPLLTKHQQDFAHTLLTSTSTSDTTSKGNLKEKEDELFEYILNQVFNSDPLNTTNSSTITRSNRAANSCPTTPTNTTTDTTTTATTTNNNDEDYMYLDTVGAICSLHVTFSCSNLDELRYLFDQLIVIAPIILSLSSCTVAYRGMLSNFDTRWPVMVQEWNDNPHELTVYTDVYKDLNDLIFRELNSNTTATNTSRRKGRCSTNSLYISKSQFCLDNYRLLNDIDVDCDFDSFRHLVGMKVDPILSRHIAHVLVSNPLSVYEEDLDAVRCDETDGHYQIFHDSNWNSVRLNHPILSGNNTSNNKKGGGRKWSDLKLPWRVEFRPMELQLTDRENAMFISTVAYLVKVLLKRRLNLYMPLSLVDLNTDLASKLESCHGELFHFREDVHADELSLGRFTLHDILFGKVGLFKTVRAELDLELREGKVDSEFHATLSGYLAHFELLTRGVEPTNATRVRRYVQSHPEYQGDGHIPEGVLYDMVNELTCK